MYHLQVKLQIKQSVKLFIELVAQIGRFFSTIFQQSRQVHAQILTDKCMLKILLS